MIEYKNSQAKLLTFISFSFSLSFPFCLINAKKTGDLNLPKLIATAQLISNNNNEGISIYIAYEPSRICRI